MSDRLMEENKTPKKGAAEKNEIKEREEKPEPVSKILPGHCDDRAFSHVNFVHGDDEPDA